MKTAAIRWLAHGTTVLLLTARTALAQITFPVTFNDPGSLYTAYYANLTANIQAAGKTWAHYLGGNAQLSVEVLFTTTYTYANGSSVTSGFVRNNGTRDIFDQGVAYELRTSTDPNGTDPDIRIYMNPTYLTTQLWLDPNPTKRIDAIPVNLTDGMSVFIHELGHALVFNGWMNGTTGVLPATYMSTFDERVIFDSINFYFTGASASAAYGASVPVTFGNPFHLGNNSPRPGSDLIPDLMNGIVFFNQSRYRVSVLDLKIAQDCGVVLSPLNLKITSVTRLASGHVVVAGQGDANTFVRIDAAQNFSSTPAQLDAVSSNGAGVFQFEDSTAGLLKTRYYFASYP